LTRLADERFSAADIFTQRQFGNGEDKTDEQTETQVKRRWWWGWSRVVAGEGGGRGKEINGGSNHIHVGSSSFVQHAVRITDAA
jgi:hypothetical protein